MNILFLSTHLDTGGITTYLFTLSKGFVHRGHRVTMATSGGNMEDAFSAIGAKCLTLNIRTKSELDPRIYRAIRPLKQYIKDNGIDIIHAQTRITQVMGQLLRNATGRPYLSTCHGFFKNRLSRRLAPCWGDAVIAISEPVKNHLEKDFGVDQKNIRLIENGVDINEFPLASEETKRINRRRFNLDDERVIGIIARLSDVKGQDILISAMKKIVKIIPNAKLLIGGVGKMEPVLKDLVKTFHLESHVIFYPVMNKAAESLSLLDVFVMPSRQEGLGLSVMEAQASGIPVVASNVGGIPSLIENGKTGILVEPENIDDLANAIVGLLQNKNQLKEMGLAGRAFIRQKYSATSMIDHTLNLYQALM
jgi:glycosyltransferase involved in cell wall biosynthesis